MVDQRPLTGPQKHVLHYVARYQTPEYGVVVRFATGEALMRRGYLKEACKRRYTRDTGLCVRLTEQGKAWVDGYQ